MAATTTDVARQAAARPRTASSSRVLPRLALVLAALLVLALPVAAVRARSSSEHAADRAQDRAAEARRERIAADERVAGAGIDLDADRLTARAAAADVAAQRAQLADLAIAEANLEQVVADARAATAATEETRDETATKVQGQAIELPQLEACLIEVRRSLDLAFHATNNPTIVVPPLSDTCRVLSTATPGT